MNPLWYWQQCYEPSVTLATALWTLLKDGCSDVGTSASTLKALQREWEIQFSLRKKSTEVPPLPTAQVMSTISKQKQKRSDIEAHYRNESKTFWFSPLKIGTEAERFGLVRIFLYQKQFVSVLAHRFWDEANQFDLVQKLSEAKRDVPM